MRQKSDDIVLTEGNNELDVSMTPVPVVIPPGALVFELRNPPAGAVWWRAIVMNGGISYEPGYFYISRIGFVQVPEGLIPEMRTFVCMVYPDPPTPENYIGRRDISPPGGFIYGARYYYDWATNTFGQI